MYDNLMKCLSAVWNWTIFDEPTTIFNIVIYYYWVRCTLCRHCCHLPVLLNNGFSQSDCWAIFPVCQSVCTVRGAPESWKGLGFSRKGKPCRSSVRSVLRHVWTFWAGLKRVSDLDSGSFSNTDPTKIGRLRHIFSAL